MTQVQLARALAVANGTIAMWETEKREPDIKTILRIANYFGVSTDYLIGNDKQDSYSTKFREGLSASLETIRGTLYGDEECMDDYNDLCDLASSTHPLSLAEACDAADKIGESVSHLLGDDGPVDSEENKKSPGPDESEPRDEMEREAIRLVRSLELPQKALALSILRTVAAENQRKPDADRASTSEVIPKIERQGSPM